MASFEQKNCGSCGVTFTPYRSTSKFCSARCRGNSYYKANPDKKLEQQKRSRENCRDQRNADSRKRRQDQVEFVNAYKLEKGCAKCGYNAHPAALDFNHLDPASKSFHISGGTYSREKLITEMEKCEVLCSNCHRVHTYENEHHKATRMGTT
jgi:hypothetical protein